MIAAPAAPPGASPSAPQGAPWIALLKAIARWLRSMNPVGMGPWAIFQKEVRASGRRRLTYWSRGLYAFALSGLILLVFMGFLAQGSVQRGAASLQQLQEVAPILAVCVLWFQFFGLIFAGPLLTGPALCDERRNRTLPALLTTPLTAGQIVSGKLVSQLVQLLILTLIPLPALLGVRVFGGLDPSTVLAGTLVALGSSVLAASWAMAASLRAARGLSAASVAWAMMMFVHGLLPAMLMTTAAKLLARLGFNAPPWLLAVVCPPFAMGMVSTELTGMGRFGNVWTNVLASLGGSLSLSILLWFITTASLRRALTATGGEIEIKKRRAKKSKKADASSRDAVPTPDHAGQPGDPDATAAALPHPRHARRTPHDDEGSGRSSSRTVADRPVLWRELRQSAFRSRGRFWLVVVGAAIFMAIVYLSAGIDGTDLHQMVACFGAVLFAMLATIATTGSVGQERDSKTWPILLSTPLPATAIVWGKFLGGLSRLWFLPALLLAHFGIVTPLAMLGYDLLPSVFRQGTQALHISPVALGLFCGNLLCAAVFLASTGIFWSLCLRRASLSGVFNILVTMILWLMVPLMTEFIFTLFTSGRGADPIGYFFCGNPVALAISSGLNIAGLSADPAGSPANYEMANLHFSTTEFCILCAGVWLAYGLVSYLLLRLSAWILRLRRDRLA